MTLILIFLLFGNIKIPLIVQISLFLSLCRHTPIFRSMHFYNTVFRLHDRPLLSASPNILYFYPHGDDVVMKCFFQYCVSPRSAHHHDRRKLLPGTPRGSHDEQLIAVSVDDDDGVRRIPGQHVRRLIFEGTGAPVGQGYSSGEPRICIVVLCSVALFRRTSESDVESRARNFQATRRHQVWNPGLAERSYGTRIGDLRDPFVVYSENDRQFAHEGIIL
mmetsp:Transcript_27943/g.63975  ORF Transcript_27943/g.63975 Transcript_27943/m.63975 type:complete len:219 (+) Transcript_27943:42-698(+)